MQLPGKQAATADQVGEFEVGHWRGVAVAVQGKQLHRGAFTTGDQQALATDQHIFRGKSVAGLVAGSDAALHAELTAGQFHFK